MTRRRLEVCLGEEARLVGRLFYNHVGNRERSSFEYDDSWLHAADAFPIDPALPLVEGPQYKAPSKNGSVFHGAVADTGPDGWGEKVFRRDHAKRREVARKAGVSEPLPVIGQLDLLLAVDDVSRIGALRFRDEGGVFCRASQHGRRTTPALVELKNLIAASRAVEENAETRSDLEYMRGRATSLGGLRPKCSILVSPDRLAIGKFPSVSDTGAVTKAEVLALKLARMAGINAAEAELVDSDGVPVAMICRYDRRDRKRIPYISAATMLGIDSDDPTERAYTEIADAIRVHGAAPVVDITELWRRIAFSILITNVDDHLWNHGFLHADRGLWRLAPAFDINPFPERARELKTWVSEDSGPEASVAALMEAAPHFGLKTEVALEILRQVEGAVATWRAQGEEIGMTAAELEHFAPAFEHGERDEARRVVGTVTA